MLAFFDAGLVEEVRSLLGGENPMSPVAAQAIGYREVIAMLEGRATLAETIERVQARSRQFAKRQATWFRGLEEVRAFPVDPDEDAEAIAERLARSWIEAASARGEPSNADSRIATMGGWLFLVQWDKKLEI